MGTTTRRWSAIGVAFLLSGQLLLPFTTHAVEFVITGPRAVGMGGAGVAVTTDSLATYWNPAGLAMSDDTDVYLQGSIQGVNRDDFIDTLEDISDIDTGDITQIAQLNALLNNLNTGSISAMAAGGLYFKSSLGSHAFGFNVSDVATGGLFTPTPLSAFWDGSSLVVNGAVQADGLEARQVAVSYAASFLDRTFAIGVTGKLIQGAAYSNRVSVFDASSKVNFTDDLGEAEISYDYGIDVGAVFQPTSWLRFAVVGKDLNEPTFDTDTPNDEEFKLVPQARAGVAINPYPSLTLTFDGDLTSNKTLTPGIKSRVFSLGLEQTLFFETLSLRAGALKNVEDAKSRVTPTAGLGLDVGGLRLDVGGGYDLDEGQALLAGSLSVAF